MAGGAAAAASGCAKEHQQIRKVTIVCACAEWVARAGLERHRCNMERTPASLLLFGRSTQNPDLGHLPTIQSWQLGHIPTPEN